MASYRLAPAASRDIEHILHDGLQMFGIEQARRYRAGLAETFAFLADYPRAARLRDEIDPPIRAHRYRSHFILYDVVDDDAVLVQRVRHSREDWHTDSREP